jgi:hypothetical protein
VNSCSTRRPDQEFTTVLSNQRCTLRFRYSPTTNRWSFDLRIGDDQVLFGRRVVTGVDLIGSFNFGIGGIFAADFEGKGAQPGRTEIPERPYPHLSHRPCRNRRIACIMRLWLRDISLTFEGDGGTLTIAPDGRGQMLRVQFSVEKGHLGSAEHRDDQDPQPEGRKTG